MTTNLVMVCDFNNAVYADSLARYSFRYVALSLSFSSFLKYVDVFGVGQIKGKGKAGRSLI